MGLVGVDGIVGDESPGVFLNGLNVYGQQGRLVHSATLPPEVVAEAFLYSQAHGLALSAFTGDRYMHPHHRITASPHPSAPHPP